MLDDSFANLKGEIQAGEGEVALLKFFHDVERVDIVIKTGAVRTHELVESVFAGVAEWRMADIVNECERFGEIGIERESGGDGARDLRDFQSVREAVAKMIGIARGENLRLGFESAERAGVDDAVAVACIVIAIGMRRLGVTASAGLRDVHRVGGERGRMRGWRRLRHGWIL